MTGPLPPSSDPGLDGEGGDQQPVPTRGARLGLLSGLVGAVPIMGPALVAGCLSCIGLGAGAGLVATSALPPRWWIVGVGLTAGLAVVGERRHARRCRCRGRPLATFTMVAVVAASVWVGTRFAFVPLVEWLIAPAPSIEGPTLP